MTDRELLELAAKAAGIELKWGTDETAYSNDIFPGYWRIWNPLLDDGDALRLAVKLGMRVYVGHEDGMSDAYIDGEVQGYAVDHNDDPYAATRRAITRAAAEIGKKE